MEVAVQHMEHEELEKIKRLFDTALHLVQAEHPYDDFLGFLLI